MVVVEEEVSRETNVDKPHPDFWVIEYGVTDKLISYIIGLVGDASLFAPRQAPRPGPSPRMASLPYD